MSIPNEIAVLAPHRHPRLRYVLYQLSDWWGIKLRLFTDPNAYLKHPALARINYGTLPTGVAELLISSHPLLGGGDFILTNKVAMLKEQQNDAAETISLPTFCFSDQGIADDFDPFALIFFCISRYEEYQTTQRDIHGRFTAAQSHALANNYLERPIVNEHLLRLSRKIETIFPDCKLRLPAYSLQLTYDIDIPYAYSRRGVRGLASGIKDLLTGHPNRLVQRLKVLFQKDQRDPYDVFEWLATLHSTHQLKPRFFWLLAESKTKFDPNLSPDSSSLQHLIQAVGKHANLGIHPSYGSTDQPELFTTEKEKLQHISGQTIEHSRQHFLRFQLPETFRHLLRAGLRHDHSMGYADHIGFRAGTNLPFYWYDLEREDRTYLRIYPFAAMDVSLKRYHQLSYFASQQKIEALAKKVKATGGPMTLLWHNSSFADEHGWKGWKEMYVQLIKKLSQKR